MSCILASLRAAPFRGKHPIPEELKLDMDWFTKFATGSNGIVLLPPAPRKIWTIECDSSLRGWQGTLPHTLLRNALLAESAPQEPEYRAA